MRATELSEAHIGSRLHAVASRKTDPQTIVRVYPRADAVVIETSLDEFTLTPDARVTIEPAPQTDTGISRHDLAKALHLAGAAPEQRPIIEGIWADGLTLSSALNRQVDAALNIARAHTITGLQERVGQINAANGWREDTPPPGFGATYAIALLGLIGTEVAEAIEELRNGHAPDETYETGGKPEGVPSELADIVIRCMDFADLHGIDLGAAIRTKIAHNRGRGHRHGGKVL